MLFDIKGKKVYVGEAKNIYQRLKTHINTPEDKIKEWSKACIINDGRPAAQSDFNDSVIRKSLEHYLIRLLKANKYSIVSQGEDQRHNPTQRQIVSSLIGELNFFLLKKNFITKLIEERGLDEVLSDDLRRLLERKGMRISNWKAKEAIINGEKAFIRPGSKKPRGWQITSRGRKPGSFIDALQNGKGYLLVSRNGVFLIPLKKVRELVLNTDPKALKRDTVDIFVNFKEEGIDLRYKRNSIDVSDFKLIRD